MRKLSMTLLAAAGLSVAGCATIMDGGDQDISFSSNPDNAVVSINGQEVGRTPVEVNWDRGGDDLEVEISADDHETYRTTIDSDLNMMFFGNIITGGPLGTTIDFVTGAMYEYSPGNYRADLAPTTAEKREDWNNEMRVVKLALTNYAEFSADLQEGEGDYLDAVLAKIEAAEFDADLDVAELQELQADAETPGQFADGFLATVRN